MEYGKRIDTFYYTQDKRRAGKTHFNIRKYYEFAIGGIVNASRCLPRRFIVFSVLSVLLLLLEFLVHFLPKCDEMDSVLFWNGLLIRFGVFGSLLGIMLLAILFEYILVVFQNVEQKPFIVEKERINY